MTKKPSYEGNEWVTTRVMACELNYCPVYFIQKAKKLEKDGVLIYGEHFFKSGASNSSSYQWNFPKIAKTFSEWRAPSKEVQSGTN